MTLLPHVAVLDLPSSPEEDSIGAALVPLVLCCGSQSVLSQGLEQGTRLHFVASQRCLLLIGDEVVKAVKYSIISQEVPAAAGNLPSVDATVLHLSIVPDTRT